MKTKQAEAEPERAATLEVGLGELYQITAALHAAIRDDAKWRRLKFQDSSPLRFEIRDLLETIMREADRVHPEWSKDVLRTL